jgi:hypothetical protein
MPEQWVHFPVRSESDVRIDPYYAWGEATDFFYLFGKRQANPRFTVSIRVRDGFTAKQLARGDWGSAEPPGKWQDWLRIPPVYKDPPLGLEASKICTASVSRRFFHELRDKDSALSKIVWRASLGLPLPPRPDGKPIPPPPPPGPSVTPPGPSAAGWLLRTLCKLLPCLKICQQPPAPKPAGVVVLGVIDDGLGFAHEHLRGTDGGTRVQHFWNQDGLVHPPADLYPYGLELTKGDTDISGIDSHLAFCQRTGIVDEDWLYDRSGHMIYGRSGHKPLALREAHGTLVVDVAGGHEFRHAPDNRPIIGVQLPVAATADTSGGTLIPYVVDAFNYILQRAGPKPTVINLSYGLTNGPHDGSSDFEVAIDGYVQDRRAAGAPLAVVLPSGNSRLVRGHARFALAAKGSPQAKHKLRWRIQPDDATPSYLEIWLPPSTGGNDPKVKVKIQPPWGSESPDMEEGDPPLVWRPYPSGQPLCYFSYVNAGLTNHRGMILVAVVATTTNERGIDVAPCGTWKISIKNKSDFAIQDIRAWIRRDDSPYGYPLRGRQSYFADSAYERYHPITGRVVDADNASYVKRDGTISSLATGRETIVVGGFTRTTSKPSTTWQPTYYSSSGPVVSPPGRTGASPNGPDGAAVSDDSKVHHGVLAAGSRSGSTVQMFGTSVAAPQVTRWALEQMAQAGDCTRADFNGLVTANNPPSPWAGTRTEVNRPPNVPAVTPAQGVRLGGGRAEFPPATVPATPGMFPIVDRKIERS